MNYKLTITVFLSVVFTHFYSLGDEKSVRTYMTEVKKLLNENKVEEAAKIFFVVDGEPFSKENTLKYIQKHNKILIRRLESCLRGKIFVSKTNPPFLPENTESFYCYFDKPEKLGSLGIVLLKHKGKIGFGLVESFDQNHLRENGLNHPIQIKLSPRTDFSDLLNDPKTRVQYFVNNKETKILNHDKIKSGLRTLISHAKIVDKIGEQLSESTIVFSNQSKIYKVTFASSFKSIQVSTEGKVSFNLYSPNLWFMKKVLENNK